MRVAEEGSAASISEKDALQGEQKDVPRNWKMLERRLAVAC